MIGVLAWFCARRPAAGNRALKAVGGARQDAGPRAMAGARPRGGAG